MKKIFELNCDMGEGIGNDAMIMPFLDACSIACGGHAGDDDSMKETILMALQSGVAIGAHPSFPDRENFGRKKVEISSNELQDSLHEQVSYFQQICTSEGAKMGHIKIHGALYNLAASDESYAQIAAEALLNFMEIPFYAPHNSVFSKIIKAKGGFIKPEAFADRRYNSDLTLVSRNQPEGVIVDPNLASKQVMQMVNNQEVTCIDESISAIIAETFCVHGDNPKAIEILIALRKLQKS